ncbi:hypothetical protein D0Z00_000489 [Geotrichum galactomycetum]|uniref:Uncharacterized protein n=1 Tax=Geotrichum galactomycetum TaxID=27317 RepID=A0ACB6V9Z9_9ASCO|nr:hypothetical protein D0Z00_000489 [Geotrichum candidum]
MPPNIFWLQDTLGRLLLVINKHESGTTFVSIPCHNRTGAMRYLGCAVSNPNRYELKAFSPTSGSSLETFAYVRSTNSQLQFVDPLGRPGARVTAMPYRTSNSLGQIIDVKGKSIPHSYQIVMTTSTLRSGRDAGDFAMGITQRAIVLAQVLSMDLDGFVLQSKSRQPGRSGLLDPNDPRLSMYQPLPLGQADPAKSMSGFPSYPDVHIASYDPYQPPGPSNIFPIYIDGMLHYVRSPSPC